MSINEVNEPVRVSSNEIDFDRKCCLQGAPVIRKASSNPFGDAKPVDTTAKLKEIDEKLEKQRKVFSVMIPFWIYLRFVQESREQRDKSPAGSVAAETRKERETPPAQTQGKTMTFVQSGRGRGRGGGHEHRGTGHHHGGHNMHVTAIAKRPTTEPIKVGISGWIWNEWERECFQEKSGEQPSPAAAKSPTANSSASRTETSSGDRTLTQTSARGEADSSTEKAAESPSHKPPPHHSGSRGGQGGRGRGGGRADYKHRGGGGGGKQQVRCHFLKHFVNVKNFSWRAARAQASVRFYPFHRAVRWNFYKCFRFFYERIWFFSIHFTTLVIFSVLNANFSRLNYFVWESRNRDDWDGFIIVLFEIVRARSYLAALQLTLNGPLV